MSKCNLKLRAEKNAHGRHALQIVINHNGKTIRLTLPNDISERDFIRASGAAYKSGAAMLGKVQLLIDSLALAGKLSSTTPEELKNQAKNALGLKIRASAGDSLELAIIAYAKRANAPRTAEIYQATASKLRKFLNGGFVSVNDVDLGFIESFDKWMKEDGLKVNTRALHLRNVRAVFNDLNRRGITANYPFRVFSIRKEETRHLTLSIDEIRALRDYRITDPQKRMYRDLFLLDFYLIGINSVDLYEARPEQLVNGRLEYRRAKTGRLYSIKLEPEALEIIERYRGKEYLLKVLEIYKTRHDFNRRLCEGLATIGTGSRQGKHGSHAPLLPKGTTLYTARRSWATIAFNDCGISKDAISLALGHSFGVSVTDVYITFSNRIVDEANRAVLDYLKGVKQEKQPQP